MPKAKPAPVLIEDTPLSEYLVEVSLIADQVLANMGSSRDRQMIRQFVERHIAAQQADARKRDKKFEPLPTLRLQQVARGLAIGVTKAIEAWEYVETNSAWPPDA